MNESSESSEDKKKLAVASIARLEQLSCLRLSDNLRAEMEGKTFDLVAGWFAKIKELDTKEAEPLVNTREFHKDGGEVVALRKDEACADAKREELLANAPASEGGFFIVPQVIE